MLLKVVERPRGSALRRASGWGSLLGLCLIRLLGRRWHALARLARLLLLVVVDVALGRSPALLVRLVGRILGVWRRSTDVIWHAMAGVTARTTGYTVRGRPRGWRLPWLAAGTTR